MPIGMTGDERLDAPTRLSLGAAYQPEPDPVKGLRNRVSDQQRDEPGQERELESTRLPTQANAGQEQGRHRPFHESRGRSAAKVDVGEQHVRRIQAARTVHVAGDDRVAMPSDYLLADRHAFGAVVRNLRLAT